MKRHPTCRWEHGRENVDGTRKKKARRNDMLHIITITPLSLVVLPDRKKNTHKKEKKKRMTSARH